MATSVLLPHFVLASLLSSLWAFSQGKFSHAGWEICHTSGLALSQLCLQTINPHGTGMQVVAV
jgi:hypothetical protein